MLDLHSGEASCNFDYLTDLVVEEQLDHLQVLVVDAHEEGGAAERVAAVDVQEAAVALVGQHP